MKIGILGGTFDPPHVGHLTLAETVRMKLGLTKVLFVPAGNPYLKTDRDITDVEHRLAMVKLAISGKSHFELSTVEAERSRPSYTVDTLAELKKRSGRRELYFILGWDNLLELPRWHEPVKIVELCYLAAVPRVGYPVPDLEALEKEIPGISQKTIVLDGPLINISSTVVRERVAEGLSIEHLVPEAVGEYIGKNGLYKA